MTLATLEEHTIGRTLALPDRARDLHRQLRNALIDASNTGSILTPPSQIFASVVLLPEPPEKMLKQLRERGLQGGAFCIAGGEKNQRRERSIPHLTRSDDAWFDFTITVREGGDGLELLAYDFEIRFPPGMGTPFLRFDLNLPAHRNQAREMRCHLHPGCDDILIPAPLMSPAELLVMFVDVARLPADRARRAPTAFEVTWFRDSHALAQR